MYHVLKIKNLRNLEKGEINRDHTWSSSENQPQIDEYGFGGGGGDRRGMECHDLESGPTDPVSCAISIIETFIGHVTCT